MKTFFWLFCCSALLFGEDFTLSYRYASRDHRLINESILIAKAMIPHEQTEIAASFELEIDEADEEKTLAKILSLKSQELVDLLAQNGVLLTDTAEGKSAGASTKTVLVMPALAIRATIKDNSVTIAVLKR